MVKHKRYWISLWSLLLILVISGCSRPEKEIVTVTEIIKPTIAIAPKPKELSLLPLYFYVITEENYDEFTKEYFNVYNKFPNQISFLSYDLVGLVYYLIYQNKFIVDDKIFYKKNKFKGKVGIFEINKNKINHILNFYVAEEKNFKKIF